MNTKKKTIMGTISDKRKFKPTKEQSNPTNPTGNTNIKTNYFNIDKKTIRGQKNKE
tara:strand:+ start:15215 stop:15382 length:168 start_codon:yes stop_codon:yes gene_type:complete